MRSVDRTEEAEALQRLRLQGVMREHRVVFGAVDADAHRAPKEGYVVEAVLKNEPPIAYFEH